MQRPFQHRGINMSYAYYEHPIECPECGYHTHELVEVPMMHDQKVLMCEGCYSELLENEADRKIN